MDSNRNEGGRDYSGLRDNIARLKAQRLRNEELREELQESVEHFGEPPEMPAMAEQLEALLLGLPTRPQKRKQENEFSWLFEKRSQQDYIYEFSIMNWESRFYSMAMIAPALALFSIVGAAIIALDLSSDIQISVFLFNIIFFLLFTPILAYVASTKVSSYHETVTAVSKSNIIVQLAEGSIDVGDFKLSQPSFLKELFFWQLDTGYRRKLYFIASHLEFFLYPTRPYRLWEITLTEVGILIVIIAIPALLMPFMFIEITIPLVLWGISFIFTGILLYQMRYGMNRAILVDELRRMRTSNRS